MMNQPLIRSQEEEKGSNSVILFRKECFENILITLQKTYGAPGYAMVYDLGKNVGKEEYKNIADEMTKLGIPNTRQNILKKALDRFTSMGWGRFQAESLELDVSTIIILKNNVFSDSCSNKSIGCTFIHGLIAGLMMEVFESEPVYTEPRCLAQQGGRCVFRIKSEKSLTSQPKDQSETSIPPENKLEN
jgi:predicted hydrocarbon binding protein